MAFFPMMLIWSAPPTSSRRQENTASRRGKCPRSSKIIIDTDPGQDDAVAILLALASPELEVLGITAVAGNVPLTLTEKNARKICELAGKPETKVFAGAIRPLVRPLVTAEEVHGKTGLNGPDLPEPTMPLQKQHAVDFIVETLMHEPSGTVTLCALGPLTNIALALIREPSIAGRIKEIVLMGGGFFEGGNVTPTAEFNIYVDPHAADVVFKSGIPIVMMPLDVTHKALTTSQAHRRVPQPWHQGRHRVRRDARILRALRRGEIRHRRRAAARPLRHRLSAEAGAVQGPALQRLGRDRVGADHGHDRRRLVGRHQAAEERHRHARHRP